MFRVVDSCEWPSLRDSCILSVPILASIEAWVCRYGIITTNGKSLDFQRVLAFAVIDSIPLHDPF
jgi:hypothetical protein